MEIIKKNIEDLLVKADYVYKEKFEDKEMNDLLNYWYFFEEKKEELQKITEASPEIILYSKYYWCTQFKNKFNAVYGKDVGLDQQQYKIIEEMMQKISAINWNLIQMIEEGKE